MRRKERPSTNWPSWRYGPQGQSAIFQRESDVPYGWTKKPGIEDFNPNQPIVHDREQLISELAEKGIISQGNWSAAYMKELLSE